MRKFNVKGETIELSENFNDILKDGLRNHRSGKFLDYTDKFDVAINGNHDYYGYYLGRYPKNLELRVYCKNCDSFVMKIACNVGGELKDILNIDQTIEWNCLHFPFDEEAAN